MNDVPLGNLSTVMTENAFPRVDGDFAKSARKPAQGKISLQKHF